LTSTTIQVSIAYKILAFVSAAGGVATASSATREDSTITPDPSPETPLIHKIQLKIQKS
jgi:hypothetical protein